MFSNLLSRKEPSGTRRYYHFDGLGSTTALSDEGGAAVATLLYDAWGNQRAASGAAVPNYRFTGAELDTASGLYHMGARFYDPTVGRWLSEDPVREQNFSTETLNFYAYAFNRPTLMVDIDGQAPCFASSASDTGECAGGTYVNQQVYRTTRSVSNTPTQRAIRSIGVTVRTMAASTIITLVTLTALFGNNKVSAAVTMAVSFVSGVITAALNAAFGSESLPEGYSMTVITEYDYESNVLSSTVTIYDEFGRVVSSSTRSTWLCGSFGCAPAPSNAQPGY